MSDEQAHSEHCGCSFCALGRGLCPRCQNEPRGERGTFGINCDLAQINTGRARNMMQPLSREDYLAMFGGGREGT